MSAATRRFVVDEATMAEQLAFACYATSHANREAEAVSRAHQTLDRWVRRHGLPCVVEGRVRRFDPFVTMNFVVDVARRDGDATWSEATAHERARLATLTGADGRPRRSFTVRHAREIAADEQRGNGRARWRLPRPLDRAGQRAVSSTLAHPAGAVLVQGDAYVEVRAPAPDHGDFRADVEMSFESDPGTADVDASPDGGALYLAPTEGIVRVTDAVRAVAATIRATTPRAIVEGVLAFLFAEMTVGAVCASDLSEADPLGDLVRDGRFDCYFGSALAVALCRAKGIPARLVAGWLLYPASPGYHYWIEVREADRWVPHDLAACWVLAMGDARSPWSRRMLGRVDARMVTEVAPRAVVGFVGVRAPADWYCVHAMVEGGGVRRAFRRLRDGRALITDRFVVAAT